MEALPSDKKKLIAYVAVIVICLAGGIYAYVSMSGSGDSGAPTASEQRLDEITSKMNEAQPPAPPPPPIPTARRGAVSAPK